MTMEMLARCLDVAVEGVRRQHLYLQLGNTSAQNRNGSAFRWLSWLVGSWLFRTASWNVRSLGKLNEDFTANGTQALP